MKTKLTKMIMSSLAFACALVCLVAAMAPGTSATARAAADGRVCSVGMLRGLYLWTFDGYQTSVGTWYRKPLWKATGSTEMVRRSMTFGTVNIGGTTIFDATGAVGTYTVAPDCTGTMSVPDGPSFNMYVGPGAQQVWTTQIAGAGATGLGVGTATRLP